MFGWELVEGKDRPKYLGRPDFGTVPGTSTMEMISRMTKPFLVTGKTVIVYSGFCVLEYFIGMYERGVYGSTVVEKGIYWSSGIYGDKVNAHFETK